MNDEEAVKTAHLDEVQLMFRFDAKALTHPLAFFLLGFAIILLLSKIPGQSGPGVILVDIEVARASSVRMYWNESDAPPRRARIDAGQRSTLEFRLPFVAVYRLRIDPVEQTEQDIRIYGVTVQFHNGTRIDIPLDTIAHWSFINMTKPVMKDNALTFRSSAQDAYFFGPVSLPAPNWASRLAAFGREQMRSDEFLVQLFLLGVIVVFLASVQPVEAIAVSFAFGVCLVGTRAALSFFAKTLGRDTFDVADAVGRAAFHGLSVAPSRWTIILAGLMAALFGWGCGRWMMSRRERLPGSVALPALHLRWMRSESLVAGISVLVLCLVLVPDLNAIAHSQLTQPFTPHWDINNVVTWAGFIAEGKRPFSDFWYPYGGFWIFDLALPSGPLLRWAFHVAVYTALGMALWRLFDGRLFVFALSIAFIVVLAEAGILAAPHRYLLSVSIVATFIAIDHHKLGRSSGRLWFWLACALTLWGEPAQLIYAAPAVALAYAYAEWQTPQRALKSRMLRAVATLTVPAGCVLALGAYLALRGELGGLIVSYQNLASSGNYGTIPTSLRDEFRHPLGWTTIGVFAPLGIAFVGAIGFVTSATQRERRLALASVGMAIVGLMTVQKHLIRAIDTQLLAPALVGSLLLLVLFWAQPRSRALAALLLGAFAASATLNEQGLGAFRDRVAHPLERAEGTYRILVQEPSVITAANRAAYAEQRLSEHPSEMAIIDKLRTMNAKSLFVLGDLPLLYLFFPASTPYHVNTYNASPVGAQQEMREWLLRTKPDIVVVDPNALVFDDIQMVVRIPLVTEEIVRDYVPFDRIDRYPLLARRRSDQVIPFSFWRGLFGASIDYGYLLTDIRGPASATCAQDRVKSGCLRYLNITFEGDVPGPQQTAVPIVVGDFEFQVLFVRVPEQRSYAIPIDRIWFWLAGEAMGLTPHLRDNPGQAFHAAVGGKIADRPILY